MSNCHSCWWADFHPTAPGKHVIHEEPDYLQMRSAFADPPMIRVVQTCYKGKSYFKTYGKADHDCPVYLNMEKEAAAEGKRNKAKAKTWKGRTSRARLPTTSNILMLLDPMTEGVDEAYNVLMDIMASHGDALGEAIITLNDMNIRGQQIVLAYNYSDNDIEKLLRRLTMRSPKMVRYINEHSGNEAELAVDYGAHAYGHKNVKVSPPVERKPATIEVVDSGKTATRRVKLKR